MNDFIEKHDIDIGKTFAIVFFTGMVIEIYGWLAELVLAGNISLKAGIIIAFFLARGMYRHNNAARRWCIGLIIALAGVMLIVLLWSLALGGVDLSIDGRHEINLSPTKAMLLGLLTAPFIGLPLAVLFTSKAKIEFGVESSATPIIS